MSDSPFFLSQEYTKFPLSHRPCPQSRIQCQKSNDIVNLFPFLSKEMVSIPGGTTKLRTELPAALPRLHGHGWGGPGGGVLTSGGTGGHGGSWGGGLQQQALSIGYPGS